MMHLEPERLTEAILQPATVPAPLQSSPSCLIVGAMSTMSLRSTGYAQRSDVLAWETYDRPVIHDCMSIVIATSPGL